MDLPPTTHPEPSELSSQTTSSPMDEAQAFFAKALSNSGRLLTSAPTPTISSPPSETNDGTLDRDLERDMWCSICFDTLKEAFITRCGHNFCYSCIVQHLEYKNNCPTCGGPLTRDEIFPNPLLNKLVERLRNRERIPFLRQFHDALASQDSLSLENIQSMFDVLLEKKLELESKQEEVEHEVLLDFLQRTKLQRLESMAKLKEELTVLNKDIEFIIEKRKTAALSFSRKRKRSSDYETYTFDASSSSFLEQQDTAHGTNTATASCDDPSAIPSLGNSDVLSAKKRRVEAHLDSLQAYYFSISRSSSNVDSTVSTSSTPSGTGMSPLARFGEHLGHVTRFTRLRPIGLVYFSDQLTQSASIVSSLDFDRDGELFAASGITRKIKLYHYAAVVDGATASNGHVAAWYPLYEVATRSKVSCLSFNPYVKAQLAASDYDGGVAVYDVSTSQVLTSLDGHDKRVWAVEFAPTDPTRLASGGDDGRVRVWSTRGGPPTVTVEAGTNVCSVRFNPERAEQLAFGCADHRLYYYDLRRTAAPLAVLRGHRKAVSYVRFLNRNEMVSASTDSTLKRWTLAGTAAATAAAVDDVSVTTYTGHVNEKNFVGLSTSSPGGEWIACGSENNSVYVYYKALPKPLLSYRFGGVNPLTGEERAETEDSSHFISSVCFRRNSNVLVAANSKGIIRVLELQ